MNTQILRVAAIIEAHDRDNEKDGEALMPDNADDGAEMLGVAIGLLIRFAAAVGFTPSALAVYLREAGMREREDPK